MVHFCGHSEFDSENPALSCLVLERGARFTAEEIGQALVGAEKTPRLVFLNACGSGRSVPWGGGISQSAFGLGNTFLLHGVGHVIVTFSDISDEAGTKLSEAFYTHLAQGESIGESLRRARETVSSTGLPCGTHLLYGSPSSTLQGDRSDLAQETEAEVVHLPVRPGFLPIGPPTNGGL